MTTKPSSLHPFISPFLSDGSAYASPRLMIQKIARNAIELLDLADCAIALLDEEGAHLVFQTVELEVAGDASVVLPLHQGPLADIAERREMLLLQNTRLDARMQPLVTDTVCTLACLPLLSQEQFVGVLIASSSREDAFSVQHTRMLHLLAEQVVMVVDNTRQAMLVRDANRMKANFLSLVTHELRSPLNTINGYLDLLLEGIAGEITGQQEEFIRRARAGSEHLYALLEDLLMAARADAGQLRLNRVPTSLAELVSSAIDELGVTALDGKVALEAHLPADLPALLLDNVRMQQVLRNLLINALRSTPAGGCVRVSARVLSAEQDKGREYVEVQVCDTGIGIAPEYHERIFERFFQVPPAEGGRSSGQGLGLTIVKMIVELHGGQVRVESTPGAGSTFVLTLDVLC